MSPSVSRILLDARKKRGIKQESLAPMVGVTRSYISKIENGETFPSLDMAQKLDQALGLKGSKSIYDAMMMLKAQEKRIKEITRKNIQNLRAKFDGGA